MTGPVAAVSALDRPLAELCLSLLPDADFRRPMLLALQVRPSLCSDLAALLR